jgi:L-lactate dehydrogenase complex protein LldE
MRVGLFIPCYVNLYYPNAGVATLRLLEKQGCDVVYPEGQTCCGQPLSNTGLHRYTGEGNRHYQQLFNGLDYVVGPSASCCLHLREHVFTLEKKPKILEICSFLTDIIGVTMLDSTFRGKVAIHHGCHGLRGLGVAQASEENMPFFSKPLALMQLVKGADIVDTDRWDECCGFGGAFSVGEEAVSVRMGMDKVQRIVQSGAETIAGTDMSCLMHLQGLLRRQGHSIQVRHVAEILCHES